MQKRLARKLDLEKLLSRIEPHPTPSAHLEQYAVSTDAAATMLYLAAYANDDIVDKVVLDLGCGTGTLALGAAFLGAKEVVGVDIDRTAVKTALKNSVNSDLKEKMQWIAGDITTIRGSFDTVLQNPPYGVQKRRADRKFLTQAIELGKVIYSLHKRPYEDKKLLKRLKKNKGDAVRVQASPFLKNFIEGHGGRIRSVHTLLMTIPHMFEYHTQKKHEFLVDLYVIEKS